MLEIKNLSFSVPGKTPGSERLNIIKDISLTIEDDKFVVITGPNGGGKSTLAKLIMGVEQPTAGQIIFNGTDITNMPIHERAKLGIGYAFQQPARFKGMTTLHLLEIAANKEIASCECNNYLSRVGLCSSDYLNREVDKSLSGGEVKRIEIATILARDPKLAIYDEPEAGIDLWSFERLATTFRQIHEAKDGRSIVIISHQERIIDLADEIILLNGGMVEKMGPKEEMLEQLGFEPIVQTNPNCVLVPPADIMNQEA